MPLAAASQRLRGRPGRPRKVPPGHDVGRADADASPKERQALAIGASAPRLLDLRATAAYLGMSEWTVRDLDAAGVLRRIRVPLANGGELRKLLFDRTDLDQLIEAWKDVGA